MTSDNSTNLSAIARCTWDVVVIGAGPAGAVAARQFALDGLNTLLVERQNWPRAKVCGGCLNGTAIAALRSIGLDCVLLNCNAAPISKFILHSRNQSAKLDLPAGLAVDRMQFDAALVDAAIDAGTEFLPATRALVTEHSETSDDATKGAHHLTLRQIKLSRGGQIEVIRAAAVVAADGLGHPSLRELNEFKTIVADSARIGLSAVVDQMPVGFQTGAIYMAVGRLGYVGMVATAGGQWNIAAAIDPAALKTIADPAQAITSILADVGLPAPDYSENPTWRGTIPLSRRANRTAAHRIVLLGDAAGYAEPFTGEGIGWAIQSALLAAPVVRQNLQQWDDRAIDRWQQAQISRLEREQMICRGLTALLRRPWAVRLALGTLNRLPSLARPLVRHMVRPKAMQASQTDWTSATRSPHGRNTAMVSDAWTF